MSTSDSGVKGNSGALTRRCRPTGPGGVRLLRHQSGPGRHRRFSMCTSRSWARRLPPPTSPWRRGTGRPGSSGCAGGLHREGGHVGPDQATGVVVTDRLPSAVRFVSAIPSQRRCERTERVLTCDLGTVPSGDSVNVRVVVEPIRQGLMRNTVEVTANESDPNVANNRDVETTRVR